MKIGGDLPTSYQRAMALQDYFTSGDFAYSQDAPVEKGYDGKRPQTRCRLSEEGRARFSDYLAVLEQVLRRATEAAARRDGAAQGLIPRPA